jgi:hypothetical protein
MNLQVNTKENYSTQDLLVVAFIFVACIAVYFLGWWPPLLAVLLACLIVYSVFSDPLGSVSKLWVSLAPSGDPVGNACRTMSRVFSRAFGSPCKSSGKGGAHANDMGSGNPVDSTDLSAYVQPQAKPSGYKVVPADCTPGSLFDNEGFDQDSAQAQSHHAQPQATLVAPSQSSAFTGTAAAHRALNAESAQQLS